VLENEQFTKAEPKLKENIPEENFKKLINGKRGTQAKIEDLLQG